MPEEIPVEQPKRPVTAGGMSVDEYLSASRLVREKSSYLKPVFKGWLRKNQADIVTKRLSEKEWDTAFTKFADAPAK